MEQVIDLVLLEALPRESVTVDSSEESVDQAQAANE
jgi:hypothetical protein